MIAALFYLQYHSTRNRLARRIQRLQQPKYLIGAIAGGLYIYFYFFRYLFAGGTRAAALKMTLSQDHLLAVQSLGALVLFIVVLFAWLIPDERAALTFTEAEVAFLFPAPVSRRTLVHYKLIHSQWRIFLGAFVFSLFCNRFGGNTWIHAAGWWLVFSLLNLHFLGASFTRTLLLDHGVSNRTRRLVVTLLAGVGVAGVVWWTKMAQPVPNPVKTMDFNGLLDYAQGILDAGPAQYLLEPFRLVVRPFFAADARSFIVALAPALLLLFLHYLWVVLSNVAFEEASLAASQRAAQRIAALRSGHWTTASKNQKARRPWFKLKPSGPVFIAVLWKNLIGAGRVFSLRFWIIILVVMVIFLAAFANTGGGQNVVTLAGILLLIALAYSLLLGPQLLRLDFRQDLPQADILKTFPVPGWQIALGEVLAPVTLIAAFQLLLLVPATVLIFYLPVHQYQTLLLAIVPGAALLLPVLDFIVLLIPNAAVLLFPSWIATGKESPRGIEATGQRLIFATGQLLVLLLTLIPASLGFCLVYFPLKLVAGSVLPLLLAGPAAAVILAGEAAAGLHLLGKLFERFDVAEEKTS